MPKGNIVAANELLLLMPTGYDFATFLVCFHSPGVRKLNFVCSFLYLHMYFRLQWAWHTLGIGSNLSYRCRF